MQKHGIVMQAEAGANSGVVHALGGALRVVIPPNADGSALSQRRWSFVSPFPSSFGGGAANYLTSPMVRAPFTPLVTLPSAVGATALMTLPPVCVPPLLSATASTKTTSTTSSPSTTTSQKTKRKKRRHDDSRKAAIPSKLNIASIAQSFSSPNRLPTRSKKEPVVKMEDHSDDDDYCDNSGHKRGAKLKENLAPSILTPTFEPTKARKRKSKTSTRTVPMPAAFAGGSYLIPAAAANMFQILTPQSIPNFATPVPFGMATQPMFRLPLAMSRMNALTTAATMLSKKRKRRQSEDEDVSDSDDDEDASGSEEECGAHWSPPPLKRRRQQWSQSASSSSSAHSPAETLASLKAKVSDKKSRKSKKQTPAEAMQRWDYDSDALQTAFGYIMTSGVIESVAATGSEQLVIRNVDSGLKAEVSMDSSALQSHNAEYKFSVSGSLVDVSTVLDLFQPRDRGHYTMGLSKNEKSERRKTQNREAAYRARKRAQFLNAMALQLNTENVALKNWVSAALEREANLRSQVEDLKKAATQ